MRPLDYAVLTTRETPPTGHHPEAIPSQRTRTPDDIRGVRQHVPRRQKIVPFVTAPAKQNHSDRRRTGDPAPEKGTYSAFRAFKLANHPPNQPQSRPPKRAARDQLRLHNPKASHPRRQDAQINYLDILAIFVKQTTYLVTLLLFGHLALIWSPCSYLVTLPNRSPHQRNREGRNVTSPVQHRFARCDLVRLLRFLRTFLQATQPHPAGNEP